MEVIGANHSLENGVLVYKYCNADFVYSTSKYHNNERKSKFDSILTTKWKEASDAGFFNYKLDDILPTKLLPGKYKIIAQLNENRLKLKRQPDDIRSVTEPINPRKFNFTKIKKQEILAEIQYCETCIKDCQSGGECEHDGNLKGSIVINTAPLCPTHSLLVPFRNQLHPQVVTCEGLTLAVHTALLADTSAIRIALNSLAGFASVNHLHFHLYYLPLQLFVETAECINLAGPCYTFKDYHSQGFVFELENQNIKKLVESTMVVVKLLLAEGIAHNIFITRGTPLMGAESSSDSYTTLRLILWARKPSYGIKDVSVFVAAVCELAGHMPIYSEERWPNLTEDDLVPVMNEACSETFSYLLPKVKKLFS